MIKNKTIFKQTLPISLNMCKYASDLLTAPRNLKDFIHHYNCKKEIFDLKKRHDKSVVSDLTTYKNFFSSNYIVDIFLFITALISLLVTTLARYLLCKHKKLRMLVASLALQQVREVSTVTTQKQVNTECKILTCIHLALTIFILAMFAVVHSRKSKLCRGHMFSNAVKIMMCILDVQCYVPIKLCKTAGSIHLFTTTGMLKP